MTVRRFNREDTCLNTINQGVTCPMLQESLNWSVSRESMAGPMPNRQPAHPGDDDNDVVDANNDFKGKRDSR